MEHKYAKLRILSNALRGEMPKGFTWDFDIVYKSGECGAVGCAIGLAKYIGLLKGEMDSDIELAMGEDDHFRIFYDSRTYRRPYSEVTPSMVADAVDEYINRKEGLCVLLSLESQKGR